MFCIGGSPTHFLGSWLQANKIDDDPVPSAALPKGKTSPAGRGKTASQSREPLAHGNQDAVSECWQRLKSTENTSQTELSSVVHSMQWLGSSAADILAELESALACNPGLLASATSLATTLLRDDAVELLTGVLKLLEQ